MAGKLPYLNAAGIPGFLWVEDRQIKVEYPDWPKYNQTIDLTGIDLDHLAGQILDVRDAEATALRRQNLPRPD